MLGSKAPRVLRGWEDSPIGKALMVLPTSMQCNIGPPAGVTIKRISLVVELSSCALMPAVGPALREAEATA
jgi:hypothetical protein